MLTKMRYETYIYERYRDLKNSGKKEFNNNDLWKIFEYYICIKLGEEYGRVFYEYADIDPDFKEKNRMTRFDTGIDLCDMVDTIVQCKLRNKTLGWNEVGTFFGSQNIIDQETKKKIIRWENLIIARNDDCKLTSNLIERNDLFDDKCFYKKVMIEYCEKLLKNPPVYNVVPNNNIVLRDYQIEAINLIRTSEKNVVICLPTGSGKNMCIMNAINTIGGILFLNNVFKYLILVPRIILMDQLKDEMIKFKPEWKNNIQLIGNGNVKFDENKRITICVFNSVGIVEKYCDRFTRIFIDEAHHISKPMIYNMDDDIVDDVVDIVDDVDDDDVDDDIDDESEEEILSDDKEDEMVGVNTYTKIIRSLTKHENNVYLSATIDKIDGFDYYGKDIRYMIDNKYLTDYTINIPIFHGSDPTNKNICEYLIKNYRNIIIYCNTQKEGLIFNRLMNTLQMNCCRYIDCNTAKGTRDSIIRSYKNGEIPFLVNVRILVEGFDAPITKGVCFVHLPSSKTATIQIIGRALRLHEGKSIASIILPFSRNDDEGQIGKFMRVIGENDSRIMESIRCRKIGGYVDVSVVGGDDVIEKKPEFELRYEMIFNSFGILVNNVDIWLRKLEELKGYIRENERLPSKRSKNKEVKRMGRWWIMQNFYHKNNMYCMKDSLLYKTWYDFINDDKYKHLFWDKWMQQFEEVKTYIKDKCMLPQESSKDKRISSLCRWVQHQRCNYKNNCMKDDKVYHIWEEFINQEEIKPYFYNDEENWKQNLNNLKQYIINNEKMPIGNSEDKYVRKLFTWMHYNKKNYKNNSMINNEVKHMWEEFINDDTYQKYMFDNDKNWIKKFHILKQHIDDKGELPYNKSQVLWIKKQNHNYKKKCMANDNIYNIWGNFINNDIYKGYFLNKKEAWYKNFNLFCKSY